MLSKETGSESQDAASGFTRRDMLALLAQAAGGAAMYQALSSTAFAETPSYKRPLRISGAPKNSSVLILGAGVAGMTAAYELRKAGYKVTVLEYREKAGGRCWTLHSGDVFTELGGETQKCEFDKGQYINPGPWRIPYHHYAILDYCREFKVQLEPFFQVNHNAYLHSKNAFGGKPQRLRHVVIDFQGYTAELLSKAVNQNKMDDVLTADDKVVLLEAMRKWGALDKDLRYVKSGKVSELRGFATDPAGGLMPRQEDSEPLDFKALLNSRLWSQLTNCQLYEYQTSIFQPVGGMDSIAKAFARELDGLIKYNIRVSRIAQDEKGVTVTATDLKTKQTVQHKADWCLCTIPLSILSQLDVQVGKPMKAAMDAVPYAASFKAGVQFKRRFWEEDERIYGGITFTDLPLRNISYPMTGINQGGKGVLLAAYTFGADAYKFSSLSPKERLAKVLELGAQIHPQYPKEFENGVSVAWHRVPWTNGCYGLWTDKLRKEHYDNLCQLDGRILLAGEHASFIPAWLEGAVLSSLDAVERLHKRVLSR